MARRRRRSARRVISVERVKKEAPARKRVNCLRERGARRVGGVVGGGVARWRSAMPLWSGERRMGIEANGTEMFVVSLGSCQSLNFRLDAYLIIFGGSNPNPRTHSQEVKNPQKVRSMVT